MNYEEYLLTCASEECVEISKEIHKALRFGMDDYNPEDIQKRPNKLLMVLEFIDMIATFDLLQEGGILNMDAILEEYSLGTEYPNLIDKKKQKIKDYWNHSKKSKGNK